MSELFTINKDPQSNTTGIGRAFTDTIEGNSPVAQNVPVLEPKEGSYYGAAKKRINVAKNFPWTKTRSLKEQMTSIPRIDMEEFYITTPSFISTINRLGDQLKASVAGIANATGENVFNLDKREMALVKKLLTTSEIEDSDRTSIGDVFRGAAEKSGLNELVGYLKENFAYNYIDLANGNKFKYMLPYEQMYGVTPTKFNYRFPYFTEEWKEVTNTFGDDIAKSAMDSSIGGFVSNISKAMSVGFGIDFAKVYNYDSEGPSTTFSFYLDNTFDSFSAKKGTGPIYQRNWELIFMLIYQNLPSKVSTLFVQPPVIYRTRIPGVMSYPYSYVSNLSVQSYGNRKVLPVSLDVKTESSKRVSYEVPEGESGPTGYTDVPFHRENNYKFKTLIPEAFKITITVKSLLPETKNLFLFGLEDNTVTSSIRSSKGITPNIQSPLTPEGNDLGDLANSGVSLPAGDGRIADFEFSDAQSYNTEGDLEGYNAGVNSGNVGGGVYTSNDLPG